MNIKNIELGEYNPNSISISPTVFYHFTPEGIIVQNTRLNLKPISQRRYQIYLSLKRPRLESDGYDESEFTLVDIESIAIYEIKKAINGLQHIKHALSGLLERNLAGLQRETVLNDIITFSKSIPNSNQLNKTIKVYAYAIVRIHDESIKEKKETSKNSGSPVSLPSVAQEIDSRVQNPEEVSSRKSNQIPPEPVEKNLPKKKGRPAKDSPQE